MHVSAAGRALIERFEGCVLHAYRDVVGVLTIGYGHIEGVYSGQQITQAAADQLLSDDLDKVYGPHVGRLLGNAPTTQAQFDAMVSLAYNVGVGDWAKGRIDRYDAGGFEDSSVLKHHLRGEYLAAADSFPLWNKAGGRVLDALTRRRVEEEKLYLSALPGASVDLKVNTLPPAAPAYTRTDAARDMQSALQKLGLYGDVIDGDWGPKSRAAYTAFANGASP